MILEVTPLHIDFVCKIDKNSVALNFGGGGLLSCSKEISQHLETTKISKHDYTFYQFDLE